MGGKSEEKKLQKPVMKGLLLAQIKRNLILTGISCLVAGLYMKFVFGYGRRAKFAEFYKNYDIQKEFNRMRVKGVFDSCDVGEDDGDDDDNNNGNKK